MNKIEGYLEEINNQKNQIELFPLEITEGTKKMKEKYRLQSINDRNDYITNLINEYGSDVSKIKTMLINRTNEMMPNNKVDELDLINNKLLLLKKVIKYNNQYNDDADKSSFNKVIYNMNNLANTDLKEVNNILLYIVNKFNTAKVSLNANNFNYSIYTRKYMSYFLEVKGKINFDELMAIKFDELYWNCPNLLIHLRLNIIGLVNENSKELEIFCKTKQSNLFKQSNTNKNNCEIIYLDLKEKYNIGVNKDPYLNINKFLNKELNINDFIFGNPNMKSIVSKFIDFNKFNKFDKDERNKFYLDVINLGKSIDEVENYRLFKPIIKDLIERYNNKDKNKGLYNIKLKEIKKLEKEKNKEVLKYFKIESKNGSNKLNKLSTNINENIDILNRLYCELEEARIDEKIYTYINDESTIYDGIKLISSFYGYLKSLIIREYKLTSSKEIDEMINKFNDFVYNNIIIMNKFNLFSDYDLELLIKRKYVLFDINVEKDDLLKNISSLKGSIEFIKKVYFLENDTISLDNIKLICDISKI